MPRRTTGGRAEVDSGGTRCRRCGNAVVCQLGLQFFPAPARGVEEFRRVLRKGDSVAIPQAKSACPLYSEWALRFLLPLRRGVFLGVERAPRPKDKT